MERYRILTPCLSRRIAFRSFISYQSRTGSGLRGFGSGILGGVGTGLYGRGRWWRG